MSNDKNRFTELCAGYVLNALSEAEISEFLQLLEEASSEELALYEELKAVASEMAVLSTKVGNPSASVKKKIMEVITKRTRVNATPKIAPIYSWNWYRLAAVACFLFAATTLGLFFYSQSLQNEIQIKENLVSEQQTIIRRLETEVERKEELLTILEARDVDLVLMDGMEDMSPNGYGKVMWDKVSGRALLQVANIPSVPTDKDYQLWFIVNGEPVSAGVFTVDDPARDNFFKIEHLQSSASEGAFAITMEPKGGMPQPTGDMYLLGDM